MIFYANAFDSRGEDGSAINGCTVHYMFWGENGTALVGQSEPDVTKPVGMQRGKSWVDYSIRNKIRIAPAIYEGTFKMDVDSKGKPVLKLVDVAYKSNVRMQAYKLDGLVVPGMLEETGEIPDTTTDPVTSVPKETDTDNASAT
uniref:Lipoprotein n=1 Tax=Syphacia muris TaxID=451379 RepID=A0A0N5ACJ2_9BILA